jgi:hypothetical protein
MKKLLPILFLLSTIYYLLSSPVMAASSATMALSPAAGSFVVGTPFDIGVYLNTNGAKVDGADIKLVYEPAKLEAQQITPETSVFPDFPTKTIDATTGKITISATAAVGSPYSTTSPIKIVTITVKPLVSGTTTVKFDFTAGATTDSNVVENQTNLDILTSVTNGAYTLTTTPSGTPPPAADLTSTLYLLASGILFLTLGLLTLKSLKTSSA